jgi:PhnB protein
MAKPIPDEYHSITPHLTIRGAAEALPFYQKAFGAEIRGQAPGPDGRLWHAEMRIGDSRVFLADEFPEMDAKSRSPVTLGGTTMTLNILCDDVDAWFERAVKAGATADMAPADMFWGDRYCKVTDPFGHSWAILTHKEDLTPEQLEERSKKAMEEFAAMTRK